LIGPFRHNCSPTLKRTQSISWTSSAPASNTSNSSNATTISNTNSNVNSHGEHTVPTSKQSDNGSANNALVVKIDSNTAQSKTL
jgi:hypothetical protein